MWPPLLLVAVISAANVSPNTSRGAKNTCVPTVKLDAASVTGIIVHYTGSSIEQFLNIPFVKSPQVRLDSAQVTYLY